MAANRVYRDGVLAGEDVAEDELAALLREGSALVWLDLPAPSRSTLERLADKLGLHELAVEDAGQERQRPKLDRYDNHLFLVVFATSLRTAVSGPAGAAGDRTGMDTAPVARSGPGGTTPAPGQQGDDAEGRVHLSEVDVFVTANALITVRRSPGLDLDRLRDRWDTGPGRDAQTVDSLLYGLLDVVVDGHFDVVQSFDDQLEDLETMLFEEHTDMRRAQRVSFRTRKDMLAVRRVVLPMREVLGGLMRDSTGLVGDRMTPYYQDVHDHVLRATEWLEGVRELASTLRETQLALQGNRLNVVMKKVTSWAAIIAVPTAITGFYGQNLPYPGYLDHGGVVTSSILIVVTSVALYLLFTRRGWL